VENRGASLPQTENKRKRDRGRGERSTTHRARVAGIGRRRIAAGEGGHRRRGKSARDRERMQQGRINEPGLGSGREEFFKNRVWAHQTVYSACPVHTGQRTVAVRCTTGQRTEKGVFSARLPVHRTLHSAVSGAHRTVR
jgi:hypothetical protein